MRHRMVKAGVAVSVAGETAQYFHICTQGSARVGWNRMAPEAPVMSPEESATSA